MRFWDASALVPLCVAQRESADAHRLLKDDLDVVAWWGSTIECWSAFARLRREGFMGIDDEDAARSLLAALQQSWIEIVPSEEVRDRAGRLLRVHPLRSLDALQLAAALAWAGTPVAGEVVVFDDRLRTACRMEGLMPFP